MSTLDTPDSCSTGLFEGSINRKAKDDSDSDIVRMKKELGLLEGVAIILGIIFGSGIFISPKGVLLEAGSPGLSIIVWIFCGLLSLIGALCYAELGTSIPKSGGDYAYIFEAFGPIPAFLYLWDAMLIFVPTTNAIMGLTFASYVITPFFPGCQIPDTASRLLAAAAICFLSFLNCYDVRLTTKLQNVFMFAKIGALVIIILAGFIQLILGNGQDLGNAWEGTVTDPGRVAVAFYSGFFCYSGWNYLNFMTEELKNPYVNLPRAIYISLPLVTAVYILANLAYFSVLSTADIIASDAIAVTFADHLMKYFSGFMSVMVAISAFGGLSVHIMTSSRMCFVGARYGHFPAMLSHINIKRYTPTPSLVFLMILSLIMLCTSDIFVLITYSSIVELFFIMMSVGGVLYLRWRRPNMARPIKVSIIIPILFVIISIFLVLVPCYVRPYEVGVGLLITMSGIPCYLIGVQWQKKPAWFNRCLAWILERFKTSTYHRIMAAAYITYGVQKLFLSAKEE